MPSDEEETLSLWRRPSEEYVGERKFHKYSRTEDEEESQLLYNDDQT